MTDRRSVTVELDAAHRAPGGCDLIVLPVRYVGAHVDHGYARTADTAQGVTVDHSLFTPSVSASAERAYVGLSRGRATNRVYATRDHGWVDAIGRRRAHDLVTDQSPVIDRGSRRTLRSRAAEYEHGLSLEISL